MAYQKISGARSTRFPFAGLGCACGEGGIGAVAQKIEVPGLRELDQESVQLFTTSNHFLGRVPWNPDVYFRALSKVQTVEGVAITPIEIAQLVNGAAIWVAAIQINAKRLLSGPHANDRVLQNAVTSSVAIARRLINVIGRLLVQANRRLTEMRGTSGLGIFPALLAIQAIAAYVVVGEASQQIAILIEASTMAEIRLEFARAQAAMMIENNRCARLLQETGQPCSFEQRQQAFQHSAETIAQNSPLEQIIDGWEHTVGGVLDPLRSFGKGISSALKTVLIIGGVAVVGYVTLAFFVPSIMRRATR